MSYRARLINEPDPPKNPAVSLVDSLQDQLNPEGRKSSAAVLSERNRELTGIGGTTTGHLFTPGDIWGGRDLSAGSATGSILVPTMMNTTMSDAPRPPSVTARLGRTDIPADKGDLIVTALSTGVSGGWVLEGAAPSEGSAVIKQIAMTPHSVTANIDCTKQLLRQSAARTMLEKDLRAEIGRLEDVACIAGTGADGQPHGIIGTAGVGSADGSTFNRTAALGMVADVLAAGYSERDPSLAFAMPSAVFELLAARIVTESVEHPTYVVEMSPTGPRMLGYPVAVSNNVPADTIIFAAWRELIFADWATDLSVNPYTQSKGGVTEIVIFKFCDVALRNPGAFIVAASIS